MNTQEIPVSPGYEVLANDPTGKKHYSPRTFRDGNLLAARQAAFQYAQNLQAVPMRPHALDITIHLVQINRTAITDSHRVICTVFKQRFRPNFIIQQGKPTRENQPKPLSLISERLKESEAFAQAVELTTYERDYYHTHSHLNR